MIPRQLEDCFTGNGAFQITATTSGDTEYFIDIENSEPLSRKIGTEHMSFRWGNVAVNRQAPRWLLISYVPTTQHFLILEDDEYDAVRHYSTSVEDYHIQVL